MILQFEAFIKRLPLLVESAPHLIKSCLYFVESPSHALSDSESCLGFDNDLLLAALLAQGQDRFARPGQDQDARLRLIVDQHEA